MNDRDITNPSEVTAEEPGGLEQSMQKLADIIARMEKGGMELEKTFALYKEGLAKLAQCKEAIDRVEKELEILEEGGDDDGNAE